MKEETKVYSDFIKRNTIILSRDQFVYQGEKDEWIIIPLSKHDNGMWSADQDDKCYTNKAAVYYWIQNHCKVINGVLQR